MKALGVDTKAGRLEKAVSLHTVEKRTLEKYCSQLRKLPLWGVFFSTLIKLNSQSGKVNIQTARRKKSLFWHDCEVLGVCLSLQVAMAYCSVRSFKNPLQTQILNYCSLKEDHNQRKHTSQVNCLVIYAKRSGFLSRTYRGSTGRNNSCLDSFPVNHTPIKQMV